MKRITLLFAIFIFIQSCKKNGTDNNNPSLEDQLSDEQIQNIEAAGIDTISTYKDALFPDGSSMSQWEKVHDSGYVYVFNLRANPDPDKKQLFINSMTHAGFLLTYRIGYPNFPRQYGLAYVFGSKSFATPSTSTYEGHPYIICQEPLYGLDCSGMIYQMAKASGVNIAIGGTADYAKTSVWNNAFKNSPDFQGLEMRDTGALESPKIQAGDIIVAPSNHIGFVFDNGNSLEVFNSLGKATFSCAKNSDLFHGPVISKNLSNWLQKSFGLNYHVLRAIQKGNTDGTFTDPRDGQVYPYKKIGTQVWMTKNLNYTPASGSWCYDDNGASCSVYGRLYDWNTALTVAPVGWHLPSDAEWTTLVTYLGGDNIAGGKMKEVGTLHWGAANTESDNSSGFTGLPGGTYETVNTMQFSGIGFYGAWWSSTKFGNTNYPFAWYRALQSNSGSINKILDDGYDPLAHSVRCVRD